jgi:hypothetical protein
MAFQTGTRVDPRLGALDFSGFTNAANIRAQAMANLGNQIGGAIQQYAVNKQKKNDRDMRYKTILPYTTNLFGAEDGENMAREFSKNPEFGAQVMQFAQMQNDQTALNRAIQSSTDIETGQIDFATVLPAYLELGGKDTASVLELTQGAMKPPPESAFAEKMRMGEELGLSQEDVFSRLVAPDVTNINTGESLDASLIRQQVKSDTDRRKELVNVANSLPEVQQMEDFLNAGAVITGPFANVETTLKSLSNKYGSSLGIGTFDDVASTQSYMNIAARNIATVIADFGSGVGISDKDVEFAKQIVAADTTLEEGALKRLVKIMKEKGIREITRYNEDVTRTYKGLPNPDASNFILNSLLIPESRLILGGDLPIPDGTEAYFE